MITIYSKANCPNCDKAKQYLDMLGIEYSEVRVDLDEDARDFLLAIGHRSVPQLYVGERLLVQNGATGLMAMSKNEIITKVEELS